MINILFIHLAFWFLYTYFIIISVMVLNTLTNMFNKLLCVLALRFLFANSIISPIVIFTITYMTF